MSTVQRVSKLHPTIYFALLMLVTFIFGVLMGAHQRPRQERYYMVDVLLPDGYQWEKTRYFEEKYYQVSKREAQLPCCDGKSLTQGGVIAYFNREMTGLSWTPSVGDDCNAGFPYDVDFDRGRNFMSYSSLGSSIAADIVCVGVLEEDNNHYRVIFVTITIDHEKVPPIVNYPF